MAYYYQPPDGSTAPSGITVLPNGQGFFMRSSSGAVPGPSAHVVGPSMGSPVVFSPHQTQPVYRQPMMAPISLTQYPVGLRPVLVTPSGMTYQSFGVAPSSTPMAQLVPHSYVGRSIAVASQQGVPFLVGSAPSVNGSYTIPSYNYSPSGIYQYPPISSPYHASPALSSPYQTSLNLTRLPIQHGPVVTIGQASAAVNPNVPRTNYRLSPWMSSASSSSKCVTALKSEVFSMVMFILCVFTLHQWLYAVILCLDFSL